jgi:hypothetical protein
MKIELAEINQKQNSNHNSNKCNYNNTNVKNIVHLNNNNNTKCDYSRTSPNIHSEINILHGSINTKYTKFENDFEEKEEITASNIIFNE